jgi:hypothetical protein
MKKRRSALATLAGLIALLALVGALLGVAIPAVAQVAPATAVAGEMTVVDGLQAVDNPPYRIEGWVPMTSLPDTRQWGCVRSFDWTSGSTWSTYHVEGVDQTSQLRLGAWADGQGYTDLWLLPIAPLPGLGDAWAMCGTLAARDLRANPSWQVVALQGDTICQVEWAVANGYSLFDWPTPVGRWFVVPSGIPAGTEPQWGTEFARQGDLGSICSETPTPTASPTATATGTPVPPTGTPTPTNTPTATATSTATVTGVPTPAPTATATATATPTVTATATVTQLPTATPTATATFTPSPTPGPGEIFLPFVSGPHPTPTATATPTATSTPSGPTCPVFGVVQVGYTGLGETFPSQWYPADGPLPTVPPQTSVWVMVPAAPAGAGASDYFLLQATWTPAGGGRPTAYPELYPAPGQTVKVTPALGPGWVTVQVKWRYWTATGGWECSVATVVIKIDDDGPVPTETPQPA